MSRIKSVLKEKKKYDLFFLTSANVLNQAIVFLSAPILSRIFSADDFGRLAVFASYVSIIGSISTGLYENVILIHESDDRAWSVFMTTCLLGILYSFLSTVVLLFVHFSGWLSFFSLQEILLLGFYVCLSALYTCILYWFNRLGLYSFQINSMLLQTCSNLILSISLGYFLSYKNALIISVVVGIFVSTSFLAISAYKRYSFDGFFSIKRITSDLSEHKKFPIYQAPANLIVMVQGSLVPVVFSKLFGMTFVGYYSMANRIVRVPFTLFTSAFSNIFKNEFRIAMGNGEEKKIFIKYAKFLAILSVIIFPLLGFFGPSLFSFWLGGSWKYAGDIAKILCFMLLFEFIDVPLRSIFMNFNKQRINLILQLVSIVVSFSLIFCTYFLYSSADISLKAYAVVPSVISIFAIAMSYNLVKKKRVYV